MIIPPKPPRQAPKAALPLPRPPVGRISGTAPRSPPLSLAVPFGSVRASSRQTLTALAPPPPQPSARRPSPGLSLSGSPRPPGGRGTSPPLTLAPRKASPGLALQTHRTIPPPAKLTTLKLPPPTAKGRSGSPGLIPTPRKRSAATRSPSPPLAAGSARRLNGGPNIPFSFSASSTPRERGTPTRAGASAARNPPPATATGYASTSPRKVSPARKTGSPNRKAGTSPTRRSGSPGLDQRTLPTARRRSPGAEARRTASPTPPVLRNSSSARDSGVGHRPGPTLRLELTRPAPPSRRTRSPGLSVGKATVPPSSKASTPTPRDSIPLLQARAPGSEGSPLAHDGGLPPDPSPASPFERFTPGARRISVHENGAPAWLSSNDPMDIQELSPQSPHPLIEFNDPWDFPFGDIKPADPAPDAWACFECFFLNGGQEDICRLCGVSRSKRRRPANRQWRCGVCQDLNPDIIRGCKTCRAVRAESAVPGVPEIDGLSDSAPVAETSHELVVEGAVRRDTGTPVETIASLNIIITSGSLCVLVASEPNGYHAAGDEPFDAHLCPTASVHSLRPQIDSPLSSCELEPPRPHRSMSTTSITAAIRQFVFGANEDDVGSQCSVSMSLNPSRSNTFRNHSDTSDPEPVSNPALQATQPSPKADQVDLPRFTVPIPAPLPIPAPTTLAPPRMTERRSTAIDHPIMFVNPDEFLASLDVSDVRSGAHRLSTIFASYDLETSPRSNSSEPPAAESERPPPPNYPRGPWTCVHCFFENVAKAMECHLCGVSKLHAPHATESIPWRCPACKTVNSNDAAVCRSCQQPHPKHSHPILHTQIEMIRAESIEFYEDSSDSEDEHQPYTVAVVSVPVQDPLPDPIFTPTAPEDNGDLSALTPIPEAVKCPKCGSSLTHEGADCNACLRRERRASVNPNPNRWRCRSCDFVNPISITACRLCGVVRRKYSVMPPPMGTDPAAWLAFPAPTDAPGPPLAPPAPSKWYCNQCFLANDAAASHCQGCGAECKMGEGQWACGDCNAQNEKEDLHCHSCGARCPKPPRQSIVRFQVDDFSS